MGPQDFTVATDAARLDTWLSVATKKSRAHIQDLLKEGAITLNGKLVSKAGTKLKIGDVVSILAQPEPEPQLEAVEGPLDILYEDEWLLLLNKAQGVVVHPGSGTHGATLANFLLHYFRHKPETQELSRTRPGIVHRLDRGTSGVLLVAKTREIQDKLSFLFKERKIAKTYEAIVWGQTPPEKIYKTAIGRDRIDRKKMSTRTNKSRPSETRVVTERMFKTFSLVTVYPKTGRTHQIRVHLTEGGHAIAGDDLYGKGSTTTRQKTLAPPIQELLKETTMTFLHAKTLAFTHPVTGNLISITAPRPKNFETLLALLEAHDAKV